MFNKLLFTLLFGMLVLPLANAQTSSMKIETFKIDNVNTRGLNPNTKGDEEFDLGKGPGWGSAMIMMGEKYTHESLQYKVQTWYNPSEGYWDEYGIEPNYEDYKKTIINTK